MSTIPGSVLFEVIKLVNVTKEERLNEEIIILFGA